MGKVIHTLITGKRPSKYIEESQSNNDDRHWKRSKRPEKQSIDDEKSPNEVFDIAQFFYITSPMVSFHQLFFYIT